MTSRKLWELSGIFLLLAVAASCGTGSTTTTQPLAKAEFLYAITISGQPPNITFNLSSFKVDTATGALTSTATIPLTQPTLGLAVDPGARFLYVSSPDPLLPAINIYSINATTGVPTPAGGYLLTTICIFCPPQSAPGSLALNPNGKFLYYGSITLGAGVTEGLGTLAVTGPTGALSAVTGSPLLVNQAPFLVAAHPSGKFVYTENLDPSRCGRFHSARHRRIFCRPGQRSIDGNAVVSIPSACERQSGRLRCSPFRKIPLCEHRAFGERHSRMEHRQHDGPLDGSALLISACRGRPASAKFSIRRGNFFTYRRALRAGFLAFRLTLTLAR